MSGQDIALLLHLLLFAYWLGGDIGVFYSSGFAINPKLSRGARQAAGTIMMNLDLIPRLCLSLMLSVGGILTHYYGIEHPLWQMIGIILLGPIWTFALIYIHFNEGTELVKKMTKIDYYFRWIMVFTLIASVTYAFIYTDRLAENPWVGAKLIVFAALIFCGIMIRKYIGGFITGIMPIERFVFTLASKFAEALDFIFSFLQTTNPAEIEAMGEEGGRIMAAHAVRRIHEHP